MGRKPINKKVELHIRTRANAEKRKNRTTLANELEAYFEKKGTPNVPSVEVMKRIISNARVKAEARSDESKALDEPWNLGMSIKYNFPPEATKDLIDVWALCLAAGREFAVRQARWVCYLRLTGLVEDNEMVIKAGILYTNAFEYANRELICEAMDERLDTLDLDVGLGISQPELLLADRLGMLDRNQFDTVPTVYRKRWNKLPNLFPEAGNMALSDLGFTYEEIESEVALQYYIDDLKNKKKIEARILADKLHAYWLRYIAKGPKWKMLSHEEQKAIVIKLKVDIEVNLRNKSEEFFESEWEPREVIKAVGYNINDDQMEAT